MDNTEVFLGFCAVHRKAGMSRAASKPKHVAGGGIRRQRLHVRAWHQRVADALVRELHRPRQNLAMAGVDHASSSRLVQDDRELLERVALAKLALGLDAK